MFRGISAEIWKFIWPSLFRLRLDLFNEIVLCFILLSACFEIQILVLKLLHMVSYIEYILYFVVIHAGNIFGASTYFSWKLAKAPIFCCCMTKSRCFDARLSTRNTRRRYCVSTSTICLLRYFQFSTHTCVFCKCSHCLNEQAEV